jgi:hypothetical protein
VFPEKRVMKLNPSVLFDVNIGLNLNKSDKEVEFSRILSEVRFDVFAVLKLY